MKRIITGPRYGIRLPQYYNIAVYKRRKKLLMDNSYIILGGGLLLTYLIKKMNNRSTVKSVNVNHYYRSHVKSTLRKGK